MRLGLNVLSIIPKVVTALLPRTKLFCASLSRLGGQRWIEVVWRRQKFSRLWRFSRFLKQREIGGAAKMAPKRSAWLPQPTWRQGPDNYSQFTILWEKSFTSRGSTWKQGSNSTQTKRLWSTTGWRDNPKSRPTLHTTQCGLGFDLSKL